jgi:hypothetical protein
METSVQPKQLELDHAGETCRAAVRGPAWRQFSGWGAKAGQEQRTGAEASVAREVDGEAGGCHARGGAAEDGGDSVEGAAVEAGDCSRVTRW